MLAAAGVENAESDALRLLLGVTGADYTHYLLHREELCGPSDARRCRESFRRRCSGEPLQYILQSQSFLGASYAVGPGVLIPRPETEELATLCIERVRRCGYRTVFDLCAGSGCIGLSIAAACENTQVYLAEKYDAAYGYLKRNAAALQAANAHLIQCDITGACADMPAQADLIVSNPPYIPSAEIKTLQREVQCEPSAALDGGEDGLAFYRCIRQIWLPRLRPGGFAAFECGETQGEALRELFEGSGSTSVLRDAFGADRFVTVQL